MKLLNNRNGQDKEQKLAVFRAKCAEMITRQYGDAEKWMIRFNPERQTEVAQSLEKVFRDNRTPSLVRFSYAYGEDKVQTWLSIQLSTIIMTEGEKTNTGPDVVFKAAADILCEPEFKVLRPTDIMLFCVQFRTGRYGKVYGSLNAINICAALREFCQWRQSQLYKAEKERERAERELYDKTAITWRQYCEIKGLDPDDNPLKKISE